MRHLEALMAGLTLAFSTPMNSDAVQQAKLESYRKASGIRDRSGSDTGADAKAKARNRKAAKAARKARKK